MTEQVKNELIKQGVIKSQKIYVTSDDIKNLQKQGETVYREKMSDGEKYFINRIDTEFTDNDLLNLIMLETMKTNRETNKAVEEIRKVANFFHYLGIISIFLAVVSLGIILMPLIIK